MYISSGSLILNYRCISLVGRMTHSAFSLWSQVCTERFNAEVTWNCRVHLPCWLLQDEHASQHKYLCSIRFRWILHLKFTESNRPELPQPKCDVKILVWSTHMGFVEVVSHTFMSCSVYKAVRVLGFLTNSRERYYCRIGKNALRDHLTTKTCILLVF